MWHLVNIVNLIVESPGPITRHVLLAQARTQGGQGAMAPPNFFSEIFFKRCKKFVTFFSIKTTF